MLRRGIVTSVLLLTLGACASSGGGAGAAAGATAAPRYRANVITAEEIANRKVQGNALDAVRELRPQWQHVAVFLNGRRWGVYERLQEIPLANVVEIHHYSPEEARGKFGESAHETINVVTK